MSLENKHPMLDQFRRAIDCRQVSPKQAEDFDKWRQSGKCPEGSPLRVEADALWARYQQLPAGAKRGPQIGARVQDPRPAGRSHHGHGQPQARADNQGAADPSVFGSLFHNPYTFLPFPQQEPKRRRPTPLTIDELERDRHTGLIELRLCTLSPLMSCSPVAVDPSAEHKTYGALRVGQDPIVPATGIRGVLRNLLTILTGGALGYLDETLWLTQGRDLPLGPRSEKAPNPNQPKRAFLGRVVRAGSATRSGTIQLGRTKLVPVEEVERLLRDLGDRRPTAQRQKPVFVDEQLRIYAAHPSDRTPWQLKLSGRPINDRGKREAMFCPDGSAPIELDRSLWADFIGRHAHGVVEELRVGDLVWLEPTNKDATEIREAKDIRSLQWSRWGRVGEKLLDVIRRHHKAVEPDCSRVDGLVDEVTDLFGQVPLVAGAAGPFAGRVRPENLVFEGVAPEPAVALAPLQPPHPGCAAFYRDGDDLDRVSNQGLPLRGYKVYRTTQERGPEAPWLFSTQGVYADDGSLKLPQQKVNKSAELIPERSHGTLRIAFRGLTSRELALLLLACCVDWRVGGGKPLGLGHCRVQSVEVRDEFGDLREQFSPDGRGLDDLPEAWRAQVTDLKARVSLWQASQLPVDRLRYPRAVSTNQNRKQRGGHAWFQRHASRKKGGRDPHPAGLEVTWAQGVLQEKAGGKDRIRAQALPGFNPAHPKTDTLFGYDLIDRPDLSAQDRNRRTFHEQFDPFDPKKHVRGDERSGGRQTPGAADRRQQREERDRRPEGDGEPGGPARRPGR
jgi:hypothetical protein